MQVRSWPTTCGVVSFAQVNSKEIGMGFWEAWILAVGIGCGLFYGLNALGREIRTGLVESAKVSSGKEVDTPNVNG